MTEGKPDERSPGKSLMPAETGATVSQANASIDTSRTGARLSAAVAETPVPKQFGRYKIEKELGKGAMGVVYLAEDTQLGRKVALKIPKKLILEETDALERFYREAKTTSQIRHPNICPVYDVGAIDGVHYLTMAYIPGKPVSSFLSKGKLPAAKQVALLIRKIALALEEAHKQGVVHRDLKPSNVMLDDRNEPIVMDFGLACQMNTAENARLTQSGAILGTPAYMAPEQVRGELKQIGPQSDIYALGVMMYQFLTGELPFSGPVMMVFAQIISNEAKRPSELRPDIDPTLEAICLKMMAKGLADRFASMKEVASALTEYLKTGAVAGLPSTTAVALTMPGVDPEPDFEDLPAFPDAAVEVRKPRSKKNRKSLTAKRTRWLWPETGAAAGVLLMVLFAVVIVLRNGKVEVQIKVDDPTAIVKVDGQQVEIDSKGIGTVRLSLDKHNYAIERNGETIRGPEEFTITKAGKKELDITATKVANPAPTTEIGTSPPPPTDPIESLSGVVVDAAMHRQAAEWALKHGADVQIERVEPEVPPWRTITDIKDLPSEDFQLVGVNFGPYSHGQKTAKSISAEGWRWLQQTRVQNLTLPPQPLTENDLSELLKCSELNTLSLISTGATNAVVPPLTKLEKLESLFLDETKVTRQGLSQLREFPALKSLSLFSLKLRDGDLEPLNSLRLETLYLTGNPITDDGLRYLQEMPLQMLYLSGTQISDQGLELLPVENMRWLILEATPITDRALDVLDRFPKLLSVGLQNTKLTPARIREFAARHPQCGVFYTENGQIQLIEPKPPVANNASSPPLPTGQQSIFQRLHALKGSVGLVSGLRYNPGEGVPQNVDAREISALSFFQPAPVDPDDLKILSELPNLESLQFSSGKQPPKTWAELRRCPRLKTLIVTSIDDDVLAMLPELPDLRELLIRNSSNVTATGLQGLSRYSRLERLDFPSSSLSDFDLERLPDFPELRSLSIIGSRITGIAGPHLVAACPKLDELHLGLAPLDPKKIGWLSQLGLEKLSIRFRNDLRVSQIPPLPNLKELTLRYGFSLTAKAPKLNQNDLRWLNNHAQLSELSLHGASDQCLVTLKKMSQLRILHLYDEPVIIPEINQRILYEKSLSNQKNQLGPAGLVALTELNQLQQLNTADIPIADHDVPLLTKLENLEQLRLIRSKLSRTGADRLKAALPNCAVTVISNP